MRHDLTSTTAKPITNGPSYTTRWDVTTRFRTPGRVRVIPNAPRRVNIEATAVDPRCIRFVYHGQAGADRGIELLIEAFLQAPANMTLTLVLVAEPGDLYLQHLKSLAEGSCIEILDAWPPQEIVRRLNEYDVGIYIVPPLSPHHIYSLPNKFFEFVQARLAVVVGPAPEMASIVRKFGLGRVVSSKSVGEEVDPADLVETLRNLTAEEVVQMKQASNLAADELSWEAYAEEFRSLVAGLASEEVARHTRRPRSRLWKHRIP